MRILMVYPYYPDSFWSLRHALKFMPQKATHPPLGLLTIAAMLPEEWDLKLIDMNVDSLKDDYIEWADYVFISAMVVQRDSAKEVIERCNALHTKVVAGGPLFTTSYDEFPKVDHFVLGEAEITLPLFLADLTNKNLKTLYKTDEIPDITQTPIPRWSLIDMRNYASMSVQYSRGCPFDCDFCDVVVLNGHKPRTKSSEQLIKELESLYNSGWRSGVFIVDDNFIGNKNKLKNEILPDMINWAKSKNYPFIYYTQTSVNMADDEQLMKLMSEAGFNRIFVGIETPNQDSLEDCNKSQNKGRDLVAAIKIIQNHGFEVQGGFIIGFDSDPPSIFQSQIDFIQNSGVVTAMVGLLGVLRGTKLYQRLKSENRLLQEWTGDMVNPSLNFVPKMNYDLLMRGYVHVLKTIYSSRYFYQRVWTFFSEYRPPKVRIAKPDSSLVRGILPFIKLFLQALWVLGIAARDRQYFWKLFLMTTFRRPRDFVLMLNLAIYGFHFRKLVDRFPALPIDSIGK
jgi:radical SAM superfamily enzyme YgiQ (UPF0313 family)